MTRKNLFAIATNMPAHNPGHQAQAPGFSAPLPTPSWLGRSKLLCLSGSLWLALCWPAATLAQTLPASTPSAATPEEPTEPVNNSALGSELFYQLLLGELQIGLGEPGTGYSLLLDAARKNNDDSLFQRATEVALQARSGDAALAAARAWKSAKPTSREANRYVLQILLALNRLSETLEPVRSELSLAGPLQRNAAMGSLARTFSRVADKKAATALMELALAEYLAPNAAGKRDGNNGHTAAAWATVGKMRQAAGDTTGALQAAQRGHTLDAAADEPIALALDLMDPKLPAAEALVSQYLQTASSAEIRMGYARALLDVQRYAEAAAQIQFVTREKPDFAQAWLVQGSLQAQDNQLGAAQASLKRYLDLAQALPPSEERSRGLAQAYLALAQVAEKTGDFTAAEIWLNQIENSADLTSAQSRRASILARQGKMEQARALLRTLPARTPEQARSKLTAEVQLLRENKLYREAYALVDAARKADPQDTDLTYDQAMLAEKLGNLDEMERLLRELISAKPDYHNAYNALGYSLADRNLRLPEAKQLILKALEYAPGDPFISDSLGWVEFRAGNKAEALRILEIAYKARPDAEIAAHLGEVLWSLNQRERALAIWREGRLLNADNETLQETIKRLRAKL
ncbi:MAG: tetratricopeptide repeat protein [Burkholderiaceae bacterium]